MPGAHAPYSHTRCQRCAGAHRGVRDRTGDRTAPYSTITWLGQSGRWGRVTHRTATPYRATLAYLPDLRSEARLYRPQLSGGTRLVADPAYDLQNAGRGECFPGQAAETLMRARDVRLQVWVRLCRLAYRIQILLSQACSLAESSTYPGACCTTRARRCLSTALAPRLPKDGGAQPVAMHDQARKP
eukprot:365151-Chlamydomonas_euryale.AAC.8